MKRRKSSKNLHTLRNQPGIVVALVVVKVTSGVVFVVRMVVLGVVSGVEAVPAVVEVVVAVPGVVLMVVAVPGVVLVVVPVPGVVSVVVAVPGVVAVVLGPEVVTATVVSFVVSSVVFKVVAAVEKHKSLVISKCYRKKVYGNCNCHPKLLEML